MPHNRRPRTSITPSNIDRVIHLDFLQERRTINAEYYSNIFFHFYLETLQHIGHIASRVFGCIQEGCVFLLLCVVNASIVKFTELILWYMNLMNNGEMDRGNENPTQHLPWWLRKTTKKPQVGRHRDLNPGPPECESRALPRSHLARSPTFCWEE